MPSTKSSLLNTLTTADLKRLLAARERIDTLEKEKAQLVKALTAIEKELAKLMADATTRTGRKSSVRKKVRRKAAGRKKKVVGKATAVKAKAKTKTKTKTKARTGKKTSTRKAGASVKGKLKLEDVVAKVINKKKGPVAFKDIYAAIVKGKLFKSKSSNFDNVLRRTLSTSKKIKRVGRGIYDVA